MPQSLAQVYLHLAWSTKNRIPFLRDAAVREEMHSYLAGACKNMDSPGLKKESSKWVKARESSLRDFYWQEGYGAFSSARRMSRRLRTTSQIKWNIIGRKISKRNSDDC